MYRELSHSLIRHKMAHLRARSTTVKEFRELMTELTILLLCEASKEWPLSDYAVETPLQPTMGHVLEEVVYAVPILRAGLGMAEGVQSLLPNVKFGHIGLCRDDRTLDIVEYYSNLPKGIEHGRVLLLDPMLATGGSASAAVTMLKRAGVKELTFLNIIAAPQGVAVMERDHPDVDIYSCMLDDGLNEFGYILPGLGDAGDRVFGTL